MTGAALAQSPDDPPTPGEPRSWRAHGEGPESPYAPLAMPEQPLDLAAAGPGFPETAGCNRALVLAATGLATLVAAGPFARLLLHGGLTVLEAAILGLFVLLFAWTAFSAVSAVAGFCILWSRRWRQEERRPAPLASRTAILVPVHNEDAEPLFARLQAMHESLVRRDGAGRFEMFVLSDSTAPAAIDDERRALSRLRRNTSSTLPVHYRRRFGNAGRKAGNIADWVRASGAAFDHMIVLDADSIMEAGTMIRLVQAMEREPRTALIQTCSFTVNGTSLLARSQQFANRVYGPVWSAGLAWWSGSEGNYWGHNAIIRVRAFADHAGLPRLPGSGPFSGEILSHDFVEAALLRRAGWGVRFEPELGGSYEEAPPSLIDLMVRDRRWCQGNLQHLPVIRARGLHWVSRLHLLRGVMAYLTSPLWLLLLGVGVLLGFESAGQADGAAAGDARALATVGVGSVVMLLLPKLLGCVLLMADRRRRRAYGGGAAILASAVLETTISALLAPILMLGQSRAITEILSGRDSGWQAQRRELDGLGLHEAWRHHGWQVGVGALLAAGAWAASPGLLPWMAPALAGMALAPLCSVLTAGRDIGDSFRGLGLLLTPEETGPSPVLQRAAALMAVYRPPELPAARPAPGQGLPEPGRRRVDAGALATAEA